MSSPKTIYRLLPLVLVALFLTQLCQADPPAPRVQGEKVPLFQKPLWHKELLRRGYPAEDEWEQPTKSWFDKVLGGKGTSYPLIPAGIPNIADGLCVYRDSAELRARVLREGKIYHGEDEPTPAGTIFWASIPLSGSLSGSAASRHEGLDWLKSHSPEDLRWILCENATRGVLSSTRAEVFLVDDIAFLPDQARLLELVGARIYPVLKNRLAHNELVAYDITTGKLDWMLPLRNSALTATHFLGPPLPLGENLYCLNEKHSGEVRLVKLTRARGDVRQITRLGTVTEPYFTSLLRRTHPARLVLAGRLLLCPTHAGALYAVDLKTQQVKWTCTYQDAAPDQGQEQPPPLYKSWRHPAPHVAGDRVVFNGRGCAVGLLRGAGDRQTVLEGGQAEGPVPRRGRG